jgi:TPR repeat protein
LQAFQILLPLAEKGEPLAQMIVGRLYEKGEGAPNDCGEAVKWSTRAAEQGNADAQFELANFYHQGHCVAKDDRTAVIWFELSGKKGDPRGLNAIGEI